MCLLRVSNHFPKSTSQESMPGRKSLFSWDGGEQEPHHWKESGGMQLRSCILSSGTVCSGLSCAVPRVGQEGVWVLMCVRPGWRNVAHTPERRWRHGGLWGGGDRKDVSHLLAQFRERVATTWVWVGGLLQQLQEWPEASRSVEKSSSWQTVPEKELAGGPDSRGKWRVSGAPRKLRTDDRNKGDSRDSGQSHGLITSGAKGCCLVAFLIIWTFLLFLLKKGRMKAVPVGGT